MFAAADAEDFEDEEDTGVLSSEEVKALKTEKKDLDRQWKLLLGELKDICGGFFVEIRTAGKLPKGKKKGYFTQGMTQKEALFANGQRILGLAEEVASNPS